MFTYDLIKLDFNLLNKLKKEPTPDLLNTIKTIFKTDFLKQKAVEQLIKDSPYVRTVESISNIDTMVGKYEYINFHQLKIYYYNITST